MGKTRILIIDDHPIISEGVGLFLGTRADFEMVGSAGNVEEGLEKLRQLHPDVVIIDIGLPGMNGLEALELYLELAPETRIIVFSARSEDQTVAKALRAGAMGYVVKGALVSELEQAIRSVLEGQPWLPQRSKLRLKDILAARQPNDPGEASEFDSLSPREWQVFKLLTNGKSTAEASDILCVSPKTIAKHRMALKNKLKVRNVAEMIKLGLRRGVLNSDREP